MFSGQSGVGKSSLLNAMLGLSLETSEISLKLGRGRHTTRHVELIELENGGYVADTPGFSQLDFLELGVEELSGCFRELRNTPKPANSGAAAICTSRAARLGKRRTGESSLRAATSITCSSRKK
ncbi:hypothetical protein HMSSN036_10370 [Paenibacillus macerans]|nr:hypothetical protein HMSSN036_10370 [Paenibacillus macerans]